jgi:hypothetical protein
MICEVCAWWDFVSVHVAIHASNHRLSVSGFRSLLRNDMAWTVLHKDVAILN